MRTKRPLTSADMNARERGLAILEHVAQGSTLAHLCVREADLRGVSWVGRDLAFASLPGADLSSALLTRVNLRNADLPGAVLQRAHLDDACLAGIDLSNANIQGASLARADLRGAILHSANLQGANLRDANLDGADLQAAIIDRECCEKSHWSPAVLSGVLARGAQARDIGAVQQFLEKTGLTLYFHDQLSKLDRQLLVRLIDEYDEAVPGCDVRLAEIENTEGVVRLRVVASRPAHLADLSDLLRTRPWRFEDPSLSTAIVRGLHHAEGSSPLDRLEVVLDALVRLVLREPNASSQVFIHEVSPDQAHANVLVDMFKDVERLRRHLISGPWADLEPSLAWNQPMREVAAQLVDCLRRTGRLDETWFQALFRDQVSHARDLYRVAAWTGFDLEDPPKRIPHIP